MALLTHFFNWLSKLLKALWLFIAGVISVGAIYYLLTGVEQGIDVVIQSGEVLASAVLSVMAVCLWSFLVWYSSRTLSYIKQHRDDQIFLRPGAEEVPHSLLYEKYGIPYGFYRHMPRLLAYNCFVSIQVAIFHLPTFFGWTGTQMLAAIVSHNLLYFILTRRFSRRRPARQRKFYSLLLVIVIAAYAGFLLFLMVRAGIGIDVSSDPLRHKFWLGVIALTMFLLQVTAVFLFIRRRGIIDQRKDDPSLKRSRTLDMMGFNPSFNAAEAPYFNVLNGAAAIALVLYVLSIFVMPFSGVMGPLAFTLLALGVLTGFSNLLTLVSIRSSLNVMVILLALAFLFGQYRDPYAVRLRNTESKAHFDIRPDTHRYLHQWFERRMRLLKDDTTATFPVYIVLSNGGASRAGKWTSSVLTSLQDTSYHINPQDSFREHVLCIAGASGGSVGNAAFYSLLKASDDHTINSGALKDHADRFFQADFLTYTMARLLGPDIFRHLLPFNIPVYNRADALESLMEKASADTVLNSYFSKPLTELFDTTGRLPILVLNTTQVDNGMPGVISSVRLPAESQRQDVLSLVDSMGVRHGKGDINLSTAAVLSSRFPYVSPAGKVFDRYYVDGGYFDNSGAGAVLDFIHELNTFFSDTTHAEIMQFRHRFTFHILHITNSEIVQPPSTNVHPLTNDLLAPILTLAGMQGSSTNIGDAILINAFRQFNTDTANALILYSLYDETWEPAKKTGEYEEGYPMSWALSDYQLNRMEMALYRANRRNLRKFGFKPQTEEAPLSEPIP
jgi:hypothetical protein